MEKHNENIPVVIAIFCWGNDGHGFMYVDDYQDKLEGAGVAAIRNNALFLLQHMLDLPERKAMRRIFSVRRIGMKMKRQVKDPKTTYLSFKIGQNVEMRFLPIPSDAGTSDIHDLLDYFNQFGKSLSQSQKNLKQMYSKELERRIALRLATR